MAGVTHSSFSAFTTSFVSHLVDTKNSTYVTTRAVQLLRSKPYDQLNIFIDETLVMTPVQERPATSNELLTESHPTEKPGKRSRQMSSKGRDYEGERSKHRK
jgi:hypothetical protein